MSPRCSSGSRNSPSIPTCPPEPQQDGYLPVDSDAAPLQQQEHGVFAGAVLSYVASQEEQQKHGDLAVHSVNSDVPPQQQPHGDRTIDSKEDPQQ